MITQQVSEASNAMRDEVKVVVQAQVSPMEDMRRELMSSLDSYFGKLEKILDARLVGHQNALENLHSKTSQSVGALQKGIGVCLEKYQKEGRPGFASSSLPPL